MVSTTIPTPAPARSPAGGRSRRRARTAWLVVGGILTVASVAWVAIGVIDLLAHERSHTVATITQPVRVIDVSNSAGSVRIEGTTAKEITVDASLSRGLGRPSHREEVEGDRLVVRAHCPAVISNFCNVTYRVSVPAGTNVRVRASGGGITLSSLDGTIDASSSGGGVHLSNTRGPLYLRSSGGGINATGLRSDRVDASSSGGGVHLAFTDPPTSVVASSSGGSVTVEVPDTADAYRVNVSSSDGRARTSVRTDPTSTRVIRATSSGGGVTVRYPSPQG